MASKAVEDVHVSLLNKLLSDSGLVCLRTAPESVETTSESGELEEQGPTEQAPEAQPEEESAGEEKAESPEEIQEELPEIFPSPSLRRVLPDRIRKIEDQNRIHVLPEVFRTDIDPADIPKIASTAPQKYIDALALMVGCKMYRSSLAEFWFLDTMANLLRRAQEDELDRRMGIKEIEDQNRIHVLPEVFRTDIDPADIPKIASTAPQKYIDALALMVGCKMYRSSLPEFWFLDTMANLLRRAQEDELDRPTQAVLILWFCEWMKEMQHFDAADRQRMLRRFQDNMLSAARFIAEEDRLPTPEEVGVVYKSRDEPSGQDTVSAVSGVSKHLVTFEGAAYECSLRDLTKIIHYIFDLFSTDYQYNIVRAIFTFPPEYTLIDAPYQIQTPKRLYAPLKVKPKKEKSPKKEVKPGPKGKKKEADTEEYLALLELMARDEREQEEKDLQDMEDWNRRSHILPLGMAADDALFDKYWPPPPPEPEPEPEPEPKGKGKGKGKK